MLERRHSEVLLRVDDPLRRLVAATERCSFVQNLTLFLVVEQASERSLVDCFGRELTLDLYQKEEEARPLHAIRNEWVRALEMQVILLLVDYILDAQDVEFIHWDTDRLVVRPAGSSSADYRDAFRHVNEAHQRSMEAALWQFGVHERVTPTSLVVENGGLSVYGRSCPACLAQDISRDYTSGHELDKRGATTVPTIVLKDRLFSFSGSRFWLDHRLLRSDIFRNMQDDTWTESMS